MRKPREQAGIAVLLVCTAASISAGCAVHRELVVYSDPPGASVRLDEKIVGVTPFTTEIDAFGTRRVTLYQEGYRPWSKSVALVAPWYARFPFDFFSEVLFPVGWHYRKEVRASLERESGPVTLPDLDQVLERAEILRKAGPEGPQRAKPVEPPE